MISPREVLIGSVVSYQGKPDIVKSVAQYIMLEGHKEWIGGSQIEGELITTEWLDILGFVWKDDPTKWSNGNLDITLIEGAYESDFSTRKLLYIHQLQLMYFGVIEEHLKIPKLNGKR